jgi:glutamine synthetase
MFYSRIQALEELKMKKPLTITEKDKIKDPIKIFASEVFGDIQLKEKIPPSSYELFKKAIINGEPLDPNVADQIATAMKEWALQKKATHFTHWFQPLTGLTAEKHDSFIS